MGLAAPTVARARVKRDKRSRRMFVIDVGALGSCLRKVKAKMELIGSSTWVQESIELYARNWPSCPFYIPPCALALAVSPRESFLFRRASSAA